MTTTTASLVRSRSAPQPIVTIAPGPVGPPKPSIQRSASHVDVEKDRYTKQRVVTEATKSRQGPRASLLALPAGDPFNLSGFFPTSLSVIRNEEEEWRWMNEAGEEEDAAMGSGGSAIFGKETSETIKREDKLGVLALKDVSLFGASAGDAAHGYGGLLSPYAGDEVVDENSLYLAQRARREESTVSGVVGEGGYGEVFLGTRVP